MLRADALALAAADAVGRLAVFSGVQAVIEVAVPVVKLLFRVIAAEKVRDEDMLGAAGGAVAAGSAGDAAKFAEYGADLVHGLILRRGG